MNRGEAIFQRFRIEGSVMDELCADCRQTEILDTLHVVQKAPLRSLLPLRTAGGRLRNRCPRIFLRDLRGRSLLQSQRDLLADERNRRMMKNRTEPEAEV